MSKENLSDVTAVILAGGLGTRLQSVVGDRQKVLAEVSGQPFIYILFNKLDSVGIQEVVLCTGHLGTQLKETLGQSYQNLKLLYSQEDSPLGTAGALRQALPLVKSKNLLVMNGDAYCEVDLKLFYKSFIENEANISILLSRMSDTSRFGRVETKSNGEITKFEEKNEMAKGGGWINAGCYLLSKNLISELPINTAISIERECFPKWIGSKFYGYKVAGKFIDIGTPESYKEAPNFFKSL